MSVALDETWEATARFFGRLLLFELDGTGLDELRQPAMASSLALLGVEVPAAQSQGALDELAAEFFETFLHPKGVGPLVQSLWTSGSYEGDSAVAVRRLAEAAAVEFDRDAARRAAHDHLGCLLLLSAEVREESPDVARRIEEEHLLWALKPLAALAERDGFYASVAGATADFIREICASS